jgi:hypothetical protein
MIIVATWAVALIFWFAMAQYLGVGEPWDSSDFWPLAYPAALALSAVMGFKGTGSKWSAGAIVIFAQVPIVLATAGDTSLLGVGALYSAILAIPAMGISWVAGTVRRRLGG